MAVYGVCVGGPAHGLRVDLSQYGRLQKSAPVYVRVPVPISDAFSFRPDRVQSVALEYMLSHFTPDSGSGRELSSGSSGVSSGVWDMVWVDPAVEGDSESDGSVLGGVWRPPSADRSSGSAGPECGGCRSCSECLPDCLS